MKIKKILDKKKKYLIAVSGGVDSMCLLHYLNEDGFNLEVVHINHQTRGMENQKEQELVEAFCDMNNINIYTYKFKHEGNNFHDQARKFRDRTFYELVKKHKMAGVF